MPAIVGIQKQAMNFELDSGLRQNDGKGLGRFDCLFVAVDALAPLMALLGFD